MFKTKEEEDAFRIGVDVGKRKEIERRNGKPQGNNVMTGDLTVEDVEAFSKERHSSLNVDGTLMGHQIPPETLIWGGNNRIAVFWVTGSSEGYYVHVETTGCEKPQTLMLAKTWDVESAETMVRDTARFIWDEWRN